MFFARTRGAVLQDKSGFDAKATMALIVGDCQGRSDVFHARNTPRNPLANAVPDIINPAQNPPPPYHPLLLFNQLFSNPSLQQDVDREQHQRLATVNARSDRAPMKPSLRPDPLITLCY